MENYKIAPMSKENEFKAASIPMVDLLMGYPTGTKVLVTCEGAELLEPSLESKGNSFTAEEIMQG